MKLGLLICDHVADRFRHLTGDYPEIFADLFSRIGADVEWRLYDLCNGEFPESLDECDAFVTTGSRASAYEERDWIVRLKNLVREALSVEKPIIGICFGHQLIAEALGGRVEKSKSGWGVGAREINITREEPWIDPFERTIALLYLHQDQVVQLPRRAVDLGWSEHCRHAIYRIGRTMLGIQAHPELSRKYIEAVLDDRRALIGDARVEAALSWLHTPTHEPLVAHWILRFLGQSSAPPDSLGFSPDSFFK